VAPCIVPIVSYRPLIAPKHVAHGIACRRLGKLALTAVLWAAADSNLLHCDAGVDVKAVDEGGGVGQPQVLNCWQNSGV
jgi:hypothetical protein